MGPKVEPRDGPTGSGGGARTHDKRINSPLLCQLSYPGREPTRYQRGSPAPKGEAQGLFGVKETTQPVALLGMTQTSQSLLLDLANSFPADAFLLRYVVKRKRFTI